MLLLLQSRGGGYGDAGWIGIKVTNKVAPFTYILAQAMKITKNSLRNT